MVMAATSAFAGEFLYSVIVNKTDGTKVEYQFADKPVATLEGDNMKMTCGGESVLYPFASIENLTFDKRSGVDGVTVDGNVAFGLTREALEASGLQEGTLVNIYDVSGALRASGAAGVDGSVSVSLDGLGSGVYVVKAGNNSFKFVR